MLMGIDCVQAVITENVRGYGRFSTVQNSMCGRRGAFFEKRLKIIMMSLKPAENGEPEDPSS
jgi:hypothetical protein